MTVPDGAWRGSEKPPAPLRPVRVRFSGHSLVLEGRETPSRSHNEEAGVHYPGRRRHSHTVTVVLLKALTSGPS